MGSSDQCFTHPGFTVRPTFPIDVTGVLNSHSSREQRAQIVARPQPSFSLGTAQYSVGSIRCSWHTATRADDATCAESATPPPKSDTVQILVLTRCPLMLMSRRLIFQVHDEFVKKKHRGKKCNGRALIDEKLSHLFTDTHTCTHKFIPNKSSVMPHVQVRCGPHHCSAQPRRVRFTRAVTTIGETVSPDKKKEGQMKMKKWKDR